MSDWAAKVLEGVPRWLTAGRGALLSEAEVLAAIARMGAGDGLVERLLNPASPYKHLSEAVQRNLAVPVNLWLVNEAAAHIAALKAQVVELKREGNPADHALVDKYRKPGSGIFNFPDDVAAIIRKLDAAEAERDALTADRDRYKGLFEIEKAAADKDHAEMLKAIAEAADLREQVARLEAALTDMPKAVLRTTVCQGPQWPDDKPGVWLAALEACAKSVQAAVDAALTDGGSNE